MQRKFTYFSEGMDKLGLTGNELAVAIGYAKGTWFRWRAEGTIPQPAGLAIECLLRRAQKNGHDENLLLRVPESKVEAMESICESMSIAVQHLNGAGP